MRFVAIKTPEQQDIQALHRLLRGCVDARTALCNQIRGLVGEYGLVARQHSSGGRDTLLGISKRGDRYLRSLLVHGARAVVSRAAGKEDRLSRWVNRIQAERGYNKAVVALANKLARVG
jgi:transposase